MAGRHFLELLEELPPRPRIEGHQPHHRLDHPRAVGEEVEERDDHHDEPDDQLHEHLRHALGDRPDHVFGNFDDFRIHVVGGERQARWLR